MIFVIAFLIGFVPAKLISFAVGLWIFPLRIRGHLRGRLGGLSSLRGKFQWGWGKWFALILVWSSMALMLAVWSYFQFFDYFKLIGSMSDPFRSILLSIRNAVGEYYRPGGGGLEPKFVPIGLIITAAASGAAGWKLGAFLARKKTTSAFHLTRKIA
jgi:hypothetical protein